MAGRLPTLLQSHLTELRRQYLEASQRGAVALKAHDIREFESAMSQKQTIHDEWMSVLENYFENHVRRNLNWRAYGAHAKRQRSATQR